MKGAKNVLKGDTLRIRTMVCHKSFRLGSQTNVQDSDAAL